MPTGTVKWFNSSKGFGFIQPDDKSKDVFVHISAVERAGLGNLNENQKISYELEQGQNGKTSAVDLKAVCPPVAGAASAAPVFNEYVALRAESSAHATLFARPQAFLERSVNVLP